MYIHDCIAEVTPIAVCSAVRATDRQVIKCAGMLRVVTTVNLKKNKYKERFYVRDMKKSVAEGLEPLATAALLMITI